MRYRGPDLDEWIEPLDKRVASAAFFLTSACASIMLPRKYLKFVKDMTLLSIGDPGVIRTRGPQIRNLVLYPAELRDRLLSRYPFFHQG